jgi:hypothetical protein
MTIIKKGCRNVPGSLASPPYHPQGVILFVLPFRLENTIQLSYDAKENPYSVSSRDFYFEFLIFSKIYIYKVKHIVYHSIKITYYTE